MTTPSPHSRDDDIRLLHAYFDGSLSAEERAAVDARCAIEPDLAAQVRVQREIDASLRRYSQPPDASRLLVEAQRRFAEQDGATTSTAGHARSHAPVAGSMAPLGGPWRISRWKPWAIAAVLLLGLLGSWQIYRFLTAGPTGRYDPGPPRSLADAYQHTLEEGFEAKWVCRDDREFALVFLDHLGDMLSMNPPLPTGIEALGLKYLNVVSPRTISMLARVNGTPIMVFIDRIERDRDTDREAPPGLNFFRRELGSLVLYEVTPLDEPALVTHLRRPETLPEPEEPPPDPPGR